MTAAEVRALLGRYDDAALEALASKGLLRRARKDVAAQPPLVRDDGDAVVVETGGQVVRFGASGAVGAQCSCPALGVCQHVLAGVIAVAAEGAVSDGSRAATPDGERGATPDGGRAATPDGAATPLAPPDLDAPGQAAPPPSDAAVPTTSAIPTPGDSLAAVGHADLLAHAGLPGYRWAWQRMVEGAPRVEEAGDGGAAVTVRFARPTVGVIYLGGPLEAMLLDPPQRDAPRYRVAAALAFQRHRGVDVVEPAAARRRTVSAADPAREDVASAQVAARARVRAGVSALVSECVQLGLAHLSASVRERFVALASTAQAAGYHRLSLLAKRLGDHVDLLLQRNAAADEHRLLDELALAAALVAALDRAEAGAAAGARGAGPGSVSAGSGGPVPLALLGQARGRFDAVGALDLVGLGAWPWRSASGYTGLTVLFADPRDPDLPFLTWTDARPLSVAGLDPLARYHAHGPWPGLATPAAATGRRVVLVGARVSDGGRLSAAEGVSATVAPLAGDVAALLSPVTSWDAARAVLAGTGGLLAPAGGAGAWVVLAPTRFGAAVFDENRQVVTWPLVDEAGATLVAEVAHGPYTGAAIARIEELSDAVAPGTLVVARLVRTPAGVIAEPISVVHPAPGGAAGEPGRSGSLRVEALAFPAVSEPVGSELPEVTAAPEVPLPAAAPGVVLPAPPAAGAAPGSAPVPDPESASDPAALDDDPPLPPDSVPAPVRDLRAWLQATSERGLSPAALPPASAELARLAATASSAGLTLFGPFDRPAMSVADLAERVVKAHVLCLHYERAAATQVG